MNSSYCNCKVVNHTKNAKQFFPQGKFTSSGSYSSRLYPYFIHPLHAIISRSIACTQNYMAKCEKCFAVPTKTFACGMLKALLRLAYLLQSEFQSIVRTLNDYVNNDDNDSDGNYVDDDNNGIDYDYNSNDDSDDNDQTMSN